MTFEISTWVVPIILTIIIFVIGIVKTNNVPDTGLFGNSLEALFYLGCSSIISLITWIIFLVLKLNGVV